MADINVGNFRQRHHGTRDMTAAPPHAMPPVAALPVSRGPPGSTARERLVEMRARLIEKLDRQIEGGDLALLSNVQASIDAIDAAAKEVAAP